MIPGLSVPAARSSTRGRDSWLLDVAAFRTNSRDEVALTDANNLVYSNIGKTRREGLEAQIRYTPSDNFEATAALARTRTRVLESLATTPWLVGSEITGVPRTLATLTATVKPMAALSVTAIGRVVGRYAISTPSSTVAPLYFDGYKTLDLAATYYLDAQRRQRITVQVNNLTDLRYASSAGVTSGTRTYNPAPPRMLMLGASLDF